MSLPKKALASLLLLAAALVLVLGGGVYWLGHSEGGRDVALRQLQGRLPAGAGLHWQSVEGTLAGGLRFERLRYADSSQRYEAGRLGFKLALTPLLFRKLRIDALEAQRVRLHLPEDDTPFEFPRWPDSLPALDLPLSVEVKRARITDLQLFERDRPLYALDRLAGGLELKPGSLRIGTLEASSADGAITLSGYYQPNYAYATRLQGRVTLETAAGQTPQSLDFRADGDAKRFLLDITGAMPEPVRVRWQLEQRGRKPFWFLSASTERFEPRRLGFIDDSAYRVQLAASGDDVRAQVAGELSRDGRTVVIEPSHAALDGERLVLEDVHVLFDGGRFAAKGSLRSGGELASDGLELEITDYPLPLQGEADAVPVQLTGTVRLSGKISAWQAAAEGRLRRGKEAAQFRFNGSGGESSLRLPMLDLRTDKGGLNGSLDAAWRPAPRFAFRGTMRDFDPSYFHADFPGAINAAVQAEVTGDSGKPWRGTVKVDGLGGQLRGRRLGGKADIRFDGLAVSGDADLRVGASHVLLDGGNGARIDVKAGLQPLDLNDINPQWAGRLDGTLQLQGDRRDPDYAVDLRGTGIALLGYRAAQATLSGDTRNGRRTQLSATGVDIDGQTLDRLDVLLLGRLGDAALQASARAGAYAAELDGRLQRQPERTVLQIGRLHLDAAEAGRWQLQAPATLRLQGGSYGFTPFCLDKAGIGTRLCAQDAGDSIALRGTDFPLKLLEPWLNNAGGEFTYDGIASMEGELRKDFSFDGSGFADIRVPALKVGVKPNSGNDVTRIDNLHLQAKWLGRRVSGALSAQLPQGGLVEGRFDSGFAGNAPLSGALKLRIPDLSWLELFSLDIAQPTGLITGEITLGGTRAAPLIDGAYRLQDFNVQIPALGLKLSDGQITAKSSNNLAMLVKGSIRSGEGRMAVTGLWDPVGQLEQPIDLRLIGRGFSLADTPTMQLTADTDLILGYTGGVYRLDGDIRLLKGWVNLETISTGVSISNDVVVLDPAPEKAPRDLFRLSLNVKVSADEQMRVSGYGLDGTVTGKIAVISPFDGPTKLNGSLNLTGKYAAYGQKQQIKRGLLQYNNALVYEPRLDILTEREIEDENLTVGLQITGSASKPRTQVVSNPSLSDSEALSWLLFGRPLANVSASQAQSINAKSMALNAGGSLLVGTLGRRVGLDQASVGDTRALGDSTLTVGKQLSPKLFVSYGVSLLGIGQVITLKYLLRQGLDISVESEQSELREQTSAALNWRK